MAHSIAASVKVGDRLWWTESATYTVNLATGRQTPVPPRERGGATVTDITHGTWEGEVTRTFRMVWAPRPIANPKLQARLAAEGKPPMMTRQRVDTVCLVLSRPVRIERDGVTL